LTVDESGTHGSRRIWPRGRDGRRAGAAVRRTGLRRTGGHSGIGEPGWHADADH